FDRQALREASRLQAGLPKPITWSLLYLAGNSAGLLQLIYWLSIAAVALFTLGVGTRLTAPLAWVIVASFAANPAFDDEADALLLMLTFYLGVGYLLLGWDAGRLSWAERLLGPRDAFLLGGLSRDPRPRASVGANLACRLIQVHLAVLL